MHIQYMAFAAAGLFDCHGDLGNSSHGSLTDHWCKQSPKRWPSKGEVTSEAWFILQNQRILCTLVFPDNSNNAKEKD